jgi:hypothetical protein
MLAVGEKLRNKCRYLPNTAWVPFFVDVTDDKGVVKQALVLPPIKFNKKAKAPAPTHPCFICQHCFANYKLPPQSTAETDGADSEATLTDVDEEEEGKTDKKEKPFDYITSCASYSTLLANRVSTHRNEWEEFT